jgi:hypothetical protein
MIPVGIAKRKYVQALPETVTTEGVTFVERVF